MPHFDLSSNGNPFRTLSLAALIAAALVFPQSSFACGPDFPNRLLLNRNDTLLSMPEGNFVFEASRQIGRAHV